MNDKLLTKKELSEVLSVSLATIDRMRLQGLPAIKMRNAVRFDKGLVQEWLDKKNT